MTRVILAAPLAAVALFAWGFVFWGVSPVMSLIMKPTPYGTKDILKGLLPDDGVYLYPIPDYQKKWDERSMKSNEGYYATSAEEDFMEQQSRGPIVQIFYHREGVKPNDPVQFALGFIQNLVAALVAGLLLHLAGGSLPSYGARVQFVFLVGLFAGVAIDFSDPIWFHQSWFYHLTRFAYHVAGWLLAGLVLALIVKAKPTASAA